MVAYCNQNPRTTAIIQLDSEQWILRAILIPGQVDQMVDSDKVVSRLSCRSVDPVVQLGLEKIEAVSFCCSCCVSIIGQ